MVKAVNKLVLEINNTENRYFEKAILYIRPEMSAHTGLSEHAKNYIGDVISNNSFERKQASGRQRIFYAVLSALVGALLTAVMFIIF